MSLRSNLIKTSALQSCGSHTGTMKDGRRIKKELRQETADIGGFTLIFEDANMELKWNLQHLDRQISITTRYLFWAAIFQGLFYWGDLMEHSHQYQSTHPILDVKGKQMYSSQNNYLFHLGLIRLTLGLFPLIGCFLVSTGLLIPGQMVVFWMNLCYGVPSLAIFYLLRPSPSHWDSLFLVYGLCFFMLPKISPLNFIFGFTGAVIFTVIFIYISAFRLSFPQWLLSNILLSFTCALFCYQTYSAERVSRERWLLRERLQRERIDLQIVASSIQDDLKKVSNEERPLSLENMIYNNQGRTLRVLASSNANTLHQRMDPSPSTDHRNDSSTSLSISSDPLDPKNNRQKLILFFKGIAAWAICYGMGYAFDQLSRGPGPGPVSVSMSGSTAIKQQGIVNSSAAFALLMHTMGFSSFLLYVTGQVRWVALSGILSFSLLWVFNSTGMDNTWVVFSTHSIGYIILATVIVMMILLFGGIVLVWSNLIEFLKDVLVRYPQVKDDLTENKLLEQVLIQYIAQMPHSTGSLLPTSNTRRILQVVKECHGDPADEEQPFVKNHQQSSYSEHMKSPQPNSALTSAPAIIPAAQITRQECLNLKKGKLSLHARVKNKSSSDVPSCKAMILENNHHLPPSSSLPVLSNRSNDVCFFCVQSTAAYFIPACRGWHSSAGATATASEAMSSASSSGKHSTGRPPISLCTPYTDMVTQRDAAQACILQAKEAQEKAVFTCASQAKQLEEQQSVISQLQRQVSGLEQLLRAKEKEHEERLAQEQQLRESSIQGIIKAHNAQLSELKRLYKTMTIKAKQRYQRNITAKESNEGLTKPAAVMIQQPSLAASKVGHEIMIPKATIVTASIVTSSNNSTLRQGKQYHYDKYCKSEVSPSMETIPVSDTNSEISPHQLIKDVTKEFELHRPIIDTSASAGTRGILYQDQDSSRIVQSMLADYDEIERLLNYEIFHFAEDNAEEDYI